MSKNMFAKVGKELEQAFLNHKYEDVTDCDFVFEILDKITIDDRYKLIAMERKGGYSGHYELMTAPIADINKIEQANFVECLFMPIRNEDYIFLKHIHIENSPMGAWQCFLLGFAIAWMPLFWHSGYCKNDYVFTDEDVLRYKEIYNIKSELLPSVEYDNGEIIITYCFWNEWQGLVRWKDYAYIDESNLLVLKKNNAEKEILHEYNCQIIF